MNQGGREEDKERGGEQGHERRTKDGEWDIRRRRRTRAREGRRTYAGGEGQGYRRRVRTNLDWAQGYGMHKLQPQALKGGRRN